MAQFQGSSAPDELDDRKLARRVQEGDQEACAALLKRHRTRIWRAAFRVTRDRDAADGVISRYTIRLLESGWGTSGQPQDVASFMCKAVWRVALDARREQMRRSEREHRFWKELDRTNSSPLRETSDAEILANVRGVLQRLPIRQREAFELVRLHGLPVRVAAKRMGVSAKRVEKLEATARASLREQLDPTYGDDLWDLIDALGGGDLAAGGV